MRGGADNVAGRGVQGDGMDRDILAAGAAAQGRAIGAGRLDPRDLTEGYLDAIAAHPNAARIYTVTTPERARAEAAAAAERAKAGLRRGPLDGVPISWKDLFDSAGTATEGGSRMLAGRVPARDAALLERAGRAGLVCLGKTHLTELAFSGLGLNPMTATPPNRHDPERVPGGSSSGAAASVAFGLAAAAVGSDTGGSIRVPAAWNDLVGVKPSVGLFPMAGALPLAPRFDTPGPLAHTVEDAALVLAALAAAPAPDLRGASWRGARLLVLETVALDDLDPGIAAGFEAACDRLAAAGARIDRRPVPIVAEALEMSGILYTTEAFAHWRETIAARGDLMFPAVRARFEAGATHAGADYVAAWARLDALRGQFWAEVAGFDAVLVPTAPILPPQVARLLEDPAYFTAQNLLTLRNTRIGNLMDACAATLPTGTPWAGLSLLTPPGDLARLLRLSAAAEAALAG